jgi:hypothetical protein
MIKKLLPLFVLLISLLLTSCGGGSGNCGPSALVFGLVACNDGGLNKSSPENIQTGRFLDGAVEGLTYETPSRAGKTNANGEFNYIAGETVTFKLFDMSIGSIEGSSVITPSLIAPKTGSPDFALNVLRFMQTIDIDNNPANGITLPSISPMPTIVFGKSSAEFATAAAAGGVALVSEAIALQHFKETLKYLNSKDTYIFNFAGKKMKAYPYGCSNSIVAFELAFTATGASMLSGTDSVTRNPDGSCSPKASDPNDVGIEFPYADLTRDGFVNLCSASSCTLSQLNDVYSGVDGGGRAFKTIMSHIKGTNEIVTTKYIIRDGVTTCQHTYLLKFQ